MVSRILMAWHIFDEVDQKEVYVKLREFAIEGAAGEKVNELTHRLHFAVHRLRVYVQAVVTQNDDLELRVVLGNVAKTGLRPDEFSQIVDQVVCPRHMLLDVIPLGDPKFTLYLRRFVKRLRIEIHDLKQRMLVKGLF